MKTNKLKFNPNNPRKCSKDKLEKLMRSIESFPEMMKLRPMVYDPETMYVLGGNQRLAAIRKLGMKDIPDEWAIAATDLTPEQQKEFVLRDNVQLGDWDFEMLSAEFGEFDLGEMGMDMPEINVTPPDATEDDFDEPDIQTVQTDIKRGDIIEIGRHRLMCGDSTSESDVNALLVGNKPQLMVTDPPYGIEYDAEWRNKKKKADGTVIGASALGKVTNDNIADWTLAWNLSPSDVAYVYHADKASDTVCQSLKSAGYEPINLLVWNKNCLVIGRGDYHHKHEPVWYCVKKGKNHQWAGSRTESTVWDIDKPSKSETGHSTQKPIECMAKPIKNHTAKEIYDPFIGSGTTMVACHQLDRICYGMEISPQYCQVIVDRMRKLDSTIEIKINGEIYV
jgi:DNA modification methylase